MISATRLLPLLTCLAMSLPSHAQKAEMPGPESFRVGDQWEWRQVDNRTKVEEAKISRAVVKVNDVLQFSNGTTNVNVSAALIDGAYGHSSKPWRVWPLEVTKKWSFESDWQRPDGVSGTTKQDVEVLAYEEVAVPAGKFMAYRIEHKGSYRYPGKYGKQNDTFWYAPDAQADVKHIRDDGYNLYTRELVSYRRGAP